jgi:isopenicillin-N N-acyltransferase-like protein
LLAAAAAQKHVSLDTFGSILSDHTYGPYAVCRHPVASEPPLQQSATRASVIMETANRTLHVAAGQPCSEAYQPYRV